MDAPFLRPIRRSQITPASRVQEQSSGREPITKFHMNLRKFFPHSYALPRSFVPAGALLCFVLSMVHAEPFQKGDEVKLTKPAPLNFRDQKFRDGKEGDMLSVVAHRPDLKKVFVLAKDKTGKDIALSVAEDAIVLVPKDTTKLQEQAITAAKSGKFDEASRLIEQALRHDRSNHQLAQIKSAILAASTAKQRLALAKAGQGNAATAAAQKRRNAAAADRPNRLNPNDTSNRERAARMREEADQMEAAAKQAVADAEEHYRTAIATFGANPSTVPLAGNSRASVTVAPGKELTEAEQHQLRVQQEADASAMQGKELAQGQQWRTLSFNTDRFVEPDLPNRAGPPSYTDTVEFINGKLKPFVEVGYGEKAKKLIIRFGPQESSGATALIDPTDLTPQVRYGKNRRNLAAEVREEGDVVLQVHNGESKITLYQGFEDAAGIIKPQVRSLSELTLGEAGNIDPLDAERLAKAFSHLIIMFGGKKEAF